MASVGYASLPIVPSFGAVRKQLEEKLIPTLKKVGESSGAAFGDGMASAVEQATARVEKARKREAKAAEWVASCEKKLATERDNAQIKAKAVESAEIKLEQARKDAGRKVAAAEQKLADVHGNADSTAKQLADAEANLEKARNQATTMVIDKENSLEKARQSAARTADRVTAAEEKLTKAQNEAAEASENVIASTKQLDKMQEVAVKSTSKLSEAFEKVRYSSKQVGSAVGKAAEKMQLHATVALGGLTALGKGAADYAADAEQSYGAAESIFENHAQKINDLSKSAADSVGLSGNAYREQASYIGAMLKNQGVPMDELADKSADLVKMGADLAATFGGPTEDAVQALGATLRGETDPIERYGVSIKQADINAKMAEMGMSGLTGEAEKQAKTQALLALLTEQTGSAQGQFGRETDTAAHKVQVAKAHMDNMKEALGTALLPILGAVSDAMGKVAQAAEKHPKLFLGIAAAIGALAGGVLIVAQVSKVMGALSAAALAAGTDIGGLISGFAAAAAPILAVVAAVTAVGVALWAFFTKTEKGRELWGKLVDFMHQSWEKLTEFLTETWDALTGKIKIFVEAVQVAWQEISSAFNGEDFGMGQLAEWFGEDRAQAIVDFAYKAGDAFMGLKTHLGEAFEWVKSALGTFFETLGNLWQQVSPILAQFGGMLMSQLGPILSSVGGILGNVAGIALKLAQVVGNVLWTAVTTLVSALQAVWNVLSPVLIPVFKTVAEILGGVLGGAIMLVVGVIRGLADAFEWVTGVVKDFLDNFVAPLVDWFSQMGDLFNNTIGSIQSFSDVFGAMGDFVTGVLGSLGVDVEGWRDRILDVWDQLRTVFIEPFMAVWDLVRALFSGNSDAMEQAWLHYKMVMYQAWAEIKDTVLAPFQGAIDFLKDKTHKAMDSMGEAFGKLRDLAAKPIKFVVETVWNNGLLKAWNGVAKLVGLDEMQPVQLGFATGGILPGYTPGRDIYNFVDPRTGMAIGLSGGESILRPEATQAFGPNAIDAINKAARQGGRSAVAKLIGEGAQFRFARGGMFLPNGDTARKEEQSANIERAIAFMEREAGKPYQWGGVGDPSWDCSGLWSGILNEINGRDGRAGRLFNTTSLMANPETWGFVRGLSGPVTVGVSSDHMAGTLAGTNAESRGGDGVLWGGSAWGSEHSYFPTKLTLASILGEYLPGATGGSGFNLMAMVKGIWDRAINAIGAFPGADTLGMMGSLPAAALQTVAKAAWDFVSKKAGTFSGSAGTSGSAESWRDMAMAAMRRQGFNADDPAQVNAMIAQIQSESGGNPGIAQQIVDVNGTGESAGVGLLQIIPGTFAANRDPALPDDRRDPWANMNAALRYYRSRYGTDLTSMWGHGHGYATGGILPSFAGVYDAGGILPAGGAAFNFSGFDEVVVNAPQLQALNALANNVGALANRVADLVKQGDYRGAGDAAQTGARKLFEQYLPNVTAFADLATVKEWHEVVGSLPGIFKEVADKTAGLVSGWDKLQNSYGAQGDAAAKLAEKADALKKAQEELAEAQSDSAEMSKQDARKLKDAEDALAKAREAASKATGDKAAAANEKVAKAEEKLGRVREDIADHSSEAEDKRADAVQKAQEKVLKAELDLSSARDVVAQAAAAAGHAEIAMAIQVMTFIVDLVKDIIDRVNRMRIESAKAIHEAMGGFVELANIVAGFRKTVVETSVQIVQAQTALRAAVWKTRTAEFDLRMARLNGVVTVAQAEKELADERKRLEDRRAWAFRDLSLEYVGWNEQMIRAAQGLQQVERNRIAEQLVGAEAAKRLMGASIDEQMAWMDKLEMAKQMGLEREIDLYAKVSPKLLALQHQRDATQLEALQKQVDASIALTESVFAQIKAQRDLVRLGEDRLKAEKRLAELQGQGTMSQSEALTGQEIARLMEVAAKARARMQDSGWRRGIGNWGRIYEGASREYDATQARITELLASEAGKPYRELQDSMKETIKAAQYEFFFKQDERGKEIIEGSAFGEALRRVENQKFQRSLDQVDDEEIGLKRKIEDAKREAAESEYLQRLRERSESLKAGAAYERGSAEALVESDAVVRAARADVARAQGVRANQLAREQGRPQVVNITAPAEGLAVSSDQYVNDMLSLVEQLGAVTGRVERIELSRPSGGQERLRRALAMGGK